MSIFRWLLPARPVDVTDREEDQTDAPIGGNGNDPSKKRDTAATTYVKREHKKRPLVAASSRLVADAEAFLSGDYSNQLRRHSDPVPGWARLNSLAHGDIETLRRTRGPISAKKPSIVVTRTDEAWRSALRVLSGELIELVDGDSAFLSRLQRCVLVPLEFQLMHEGDLTAFELVQFTRAALRSCIS